MGRREGDMRKEGGREEEESSEHAACVGWDCLCVVISYIIAL